MIGLFGSLNLATRALSTQREGTEVAGHNLANVNNPAYARQRLSITTSPTIPTQMGPQGTGVQSVGITQIRNGLLDRQILTETSVLGSLNAQQSALQYAQSSLGQLIDRQASSPDGTGAASGVGGQHGIAEDLSSFFNAFQSLSTNPTSTTERQSTLLKAQDLASQFQQVGSRLNDVHQLLNQSIESDVDVANAALDDIAKLNQQIVRTEVDGGVANDLRDVRQARLEELGKLVSISTAEQPGGAVDISIGGKVMIAGASVLDRLQVYDAGDGQTLVRSESSGAPISITGGSIEGTIEARDGALGNLRASLDTLASELIREVNAIHVGGFGLSGTTGEAFFTGTNASSIGVNAVLMDDPTKVQASGVAGAAGDNQVALALAQLADKSIAGLGNHTFSESYGDTVAGLGQSLASINTQIDNQNIVGGMLSRQRDSISGVSLDEEMTDLIRFQKAFEASARLVSIIDEMLDTVIGMKR